MLKFIKRLFISLIISFIISIIGFMIYIGQLDLNSYKSQITSLIAKHTGYKSVINGDINITYFPKLKLQVHQINLSNNHAVNIKIPKLSASLELIPLLNKKFIISDVELNKPNFKLSIKTSSKKINKKIFNNKLKQGSLKKSTVNKRKVQELKQLSLFTLKTIKVIQARLKIIKGNEIIQLSDINFVAKNININKETNFKLSTKLEVTTSNRAIKTTLKLIGLGKLDIQEIKQSNLISALRIKVKLSSPAIFYNKLHFENLIGSINIDKGIINISINQLNAYQGNINGQLLLNKVNNKIKTHVKLNAVEIDKLLLDLNGIKVLSGKLNSEVNLETTFNLASDKIANLNGDVITNIKNGALNSIDVNALVKSVNKIISEPHSMKQLMAIGLNHFDNQILFNRNSTLFKLLTAKTYIKQGVATTRNLQITTEHLKLFGKGIVFLKQEKLDIHLNISTVDSKSKINKTLAVLDGYIPITIKGSIKHPQLSPNFKFILNKLKKNLFTNKNISDSIKNFKNKIQELRKLF